jgi:hypothetical protein
MNCLSFEFHKLISIFSYLAGNYRLLIGTGGEST